jgi:hypothetical protein
VYSTPKAARLHQKSSKKENFLRSRARVADNVKWYPTIPPHGFIQEARGKKQEARSKKSELLPLASCFLPLAS